MESIAADRDDLSKLLADLEALLERVDELELDVVGAHLSMALDAARQQSVLPATDTAGQPGSTPGIC